MSGGGRHGFDAPFVPAACHYRWYSTTEVCMILDRFDAIVFIGDNLLQHIYAAFNILLRENMAMGSLKQWEMSEDERVNCRCDNQITRPECSKYAVLDSEDVRKNDPGSGHTSPYHCNRMCPSQAVLQGDEWADAYRHPKLHASNNNIAVFRRAPYHSHRNPGQGSRLLQTRSGNSFSGSRHFSLLARSNSLNGRVACGSRCFVA